MAFTRTSIQAALNEAFSKETLGSVSLNESLKSLDEKATGEQKAQMAINALSAHAGNLSGSEKKKFWDEIRNKIIMMTASEDTPDSTDVNESMGGGVRGALGTLWQYIENLTGSGYIDPKQAKILEKSVEALEKIWIKTLKGSGLSGF